jgi:type II secretory pathway component PulK
VLVVVMILMLVGYQFFRLMGAELQAAQASNRITQSRYLADSGLHYSMFVLSYPQTAGLSDASDSFAPALSALYDNPGVFHLRPVTVGSRRQGYFSIVAPRDIDDPLFLTQGFRFGVEDESGKINVNALLRLTNNDMNQVRDMLYKLPGATQELVDSTLNWIRPANASTDSSDDLYYTSMGYSAKHGQLESLEEMLLIRGFTPRLLMGNDLNRNGRLEPEEDDIGGLLDNGLSRYLTIYSRELNVDSTGQQRVWLNDTDLSSLWDKLSTAVGEELANFIIGYRLYGQQQQGLTFTITIGQNSTPVNSVATVALADGPWELEVRGNLVASDTPSLFGQQQKTYATLTKDDLKLDADPAPTPRLTVASIFDLIDAEFSITTRVDGRNQTRYYKSPLQRADTTALRELLPLIFDKTSSKQELELTPRVNINTAPREILEAFPGITEEQVSHILEVRPGPDVDASQAAIYRTPAWLITEAGLEPAIVKAFEPFVTTKSQVYRLQVVGYYELGGPTVRLEAVIDTNNGRPRILYWRDLTELGRGFDLTGASSMVP